MYHVMRRDLLADSKLKDPPKCDIKEDPSKGVFVTNLTDVIVEKEEEMDAVLNKGLHNRTVGSTLMNAESSRSHSIFTIVIEMNTKDPETGKDHIRAGKLNLVDLAGSERQKKTGASGDRLKEGSKINLSLSALGNVISALSEGGAKHIPYRDSKLTRLLQDSLGGNTKTLMVAAISPADYNYDETLSTLRYANRAKNIKNKPKINEDPKDTMLREYKEEIEKLRKMLAEQAEMLKGGDPTAFNAMMQMQANFAAAHPTVAQVTHTAAAAGETDGDDVDFASLGAVSESSKKKMSPRPPRSPRFDNEDVRSPRVIEKKVEVLVEKIPDEHLEHHRALENYSKAVEVERDKYGEQLRAAEEAAATEKQQRLDLENRLNDLQRKLMGQQESGHDAPPGGAAPVASEDVNGEINLSNYQFPSEVVEDNSYTNGAQAPSQAAVVESEAVAKEREAALVRIRERKRKAKKKADAKLRAEKERALKESNDIQEELDDLKDVVADTSQSKEQTEKKLTRLRKKYERKVGALEADRTDLIEQFGIERNNMLDTIRDQQQDIKLYEQICRTLLSNKKMNQIIDKARWSEEDDEWTLPYFRGDGDGGDYGSSRLPDINKDAVVSPRAPSSGAPGIAFPRNVNSEAKNFFPSNSSLPPAFGKKQATSKSGDEDDGYSSGHNSDKKSRKLKERDGEFLQLPEFSNRTVLPSAGSAQASARSEYASREGRDNSPMEGEKKKKKKKKPYDETKAKQTLMVCVLCPGYVTCLLLLLMCSFCRTETDRRRTRGPSAIGASPVTILKMRTPMARKSAEINRPVATGSPRLAYPRRHTQLL